MYFKRVSSKIGTTTKLGEFLFEWTLEEQASGGTPAINYTSEEYLKNAEAGLQRTYKDLGMDSLQLSGQYAFHSIPAFIQGADETEQYYFHPDHLGSSNYITNFVGTVTQHMEYFAFGETFVEEHKNSHNSPYKYNGKELDEETGWYYYGARYYDARVSLWLSVDPLAERFFGRSPYEYTFSNPINLIDPTGMEPIPNWVKFFSNVLNLVSNGLSGLSDPNRNCPMCCLKALASNLKATYGLPSTTPIKTDGTLSTAVTSLNKENYKKINNVAPTYHGKRLTSRSHYNLDASNIDKKNIVSNIPSKLKELTPNDGISVFALGMGAEYHSTMVVVLKDATQSVDIKGVTYTGSNTNPIFLYIEDLGGARAFTESEFEKNMQDWIFSAWKFYRGEKQVSGARNGDKTKDVSIDATLFQMYIEDGNSNNQENNEQDKTRANFTIE